MSHKLEEPYSGKNPVPQIATKLTALVNPEHATRAKAAQLQDQSGRHDQKQTEKRARRLAKGYVMHVVDPVTGDELDIKNADEEPDLSNKGENNISQRDFDDRVWDSERIRGLRAGSDLDGDGVVGPDERVRESAEWANAILRGVWPILNPDM
ncbi:hypothetical protein EIP86_010730 [Pleurotus ostreatoroseus]|nr:hypothetical protein EIP86_010730 [Pleurotus ostreatoroseus]